MKAAIISLGLASLASGLVIEKRQDLSQVAKMVPGLAPIVVDAKPQYNPKAIRKLLRFGPFKLPANKGDDSGKPKESMSGHAHGGSGGMSPPKGSLEAGAALASQKPMDPNGFGSTKRVIGGFCTDCTVLAGKTTTVFENGSPATIKQGVYLHHAVAIDTTKTKPAYLPGCPKDSAAGKGGGGISPFLGGAVDEFTQMYTTPDGKLESGYLIRNHTFLLQTEIVNYLPTEQTVYVQVDVEYLPGLVGQDASQGTLAATPCDNALQGFAPKKNEVGFIQSIEFDVPRSGSLIAIRGHMHDGGTSVKMVVSGREVCLSKAIYGGTSTLIVDGKEWQTITKMTECTGPVKIKKGEKIQVTATYDTKNHPLRESHGEAQEGMGIMTYVFVPDK